MQVSDTPTSRQLAREQAARAVRADGRHAGSISAGPWWRVVRSPRLLAAGVAAGVLLLVVGWWVRQPYGSEFWRQAAGASAAGLTGATDDDGHHDDAPSHLELSPQARKNIGLTVATVHRRDFARSISVPGVIGERPGKTLITVSAPVGGVVRQIIPLRGESVAPGAMMFEIGLNHEHLIDRQRSLLLAVEQLDVVRREIERLDQATSSGAVAGRHRLEREYERQTVEATIHAETQALILHGFSHEQVQAVMANRRLLSSLSVYAPPLAHGDHHEHSYHVVELNVRPGDYVEAGQSMALLADHCELFVEGRAFERDAAVLHRAAERQSGVGLLVETSDGRKQEVYPLEILYVENEVDRASRALKFYVRLENEVVRETRTPDGRRFHSWRFKSGQRVELRVPFEQWPDRLVLPVEAVVREGTEWFVYCEQDGRFERTSVHVEHRDQQWAVVADDGQLHVGDVVAVQGAYQIHLALKQQSGGGHDAHAGHHH